MRPIFHDLGDHVAGDTFEALEFSMTENGEPMDLSTTDIRASFRSSSGAIVKALTTGSGITIQDAPGGRWRIDNFEIELGPGVYGYDVQFTKGAVKKTYLNGRIKILPQITI